MAQYVAIIDAGSTKSELFIYRYALVAIVGDPARTAGAEVVENIPCTVPECRSDTPIDNQADDAAMRGHLRPLLTAGLDKLCNLPQAINCGLGGPERQVPVYVLATAGVRGRTDSTAIMRRAWDAINWFKGDDERGVVYDIGPADVVDNAIRDAFSFVVPALDEGVYAWIAMNNDKGVADKRFGITELGGKSMQVAYENPAAAGGSSKEVCLFSSKYRVMSHIWKSAGVRYD